MELLIIFVTAFAMVVLTGMNRFSRQLDKGVEAPSRAWQLSRGLMKTMHRVMLSSGGLLLISLIIGGWLDDQYPTLHVPTLTTVLSYLIVFGGFVLSASAIVITASLIWRVILRWGARNLIQKAQQAVLSRVSTQQSKHLLKFIGQLCFAVCAVAIQMVAGFFLLFIRRGLVMESEDDELDAFFDYEDGRWDNANGGIYGHNEDY